VFLEHFQETMTVRQMREQLRSTGAIGPAERPKAVPITHILLFKFGTDWHSLVNSTQGDNQVSLSLPLPLSCQAALAIMWSREYSY